jgi:hypothetical protein
MTNIFYVADSGDNAFVMNLEKPLVAVVRDAAIPQLSPNHMRLVLNSMMKVLVDTDYDLYAIRIKNINRGILGYEFTIHDPLLVLQFKLTYC